MFKAAIRVNKITSIAQLRGATLHAERADETSQARLREGAEPGAALAWSKAPQSDRDYLAAHKAHKAELGAGERKGAPLCMQALCVISPEWVKATGDLHAVLANALLVVAGGHALVAIYHQFVIRDGLLARMTRPGSM